MKKKGIVAEGAVSVGPYSHAVEIDGFVFVSGQTPIDSKTGALVEGDIQAQTEQAFTNVFNVLKSAGLTSDDVIKVTVYLKEMSNFSAMNNIYKTKFTEPYPARSTIGVNELPLNAMVEIEVIAKR